MHPHFNCSTAFNCSSDQKLDDEKTWECGYWSGQNDLFFMEGRHNCMMSGTSLAHKLKFLFHLQNYQVGINNNEVDAYQLT